MGMFDFVSKIGKKLGIDYFEEKERIKDLEDTKAKADAEAALQAQLKTKLEKAVAALNLGLEGFTVTLEGSTAKLSGTAKSQSDLEKAVMCVGNHAGITKVDDSGIKVVVPEPPGLFHEVSKGDTLSLIAKRYYGIIMAYPEIEKANQPLIANADLIDVGWIIRVPAIEGIRYTIAKGDTLSGVAKTMYGDPKKYTVIAEANKAIIPNPDAVSPGLEVKIPVLHPLPAPVALG